MTNTACTALFVISLLVSAAAQCSHSVMFPSMLSKSCTALSLQSEPQRSPSLSLQWPQTTQIRKKQIEKKNILLTSKWCTVFQSPWGRIANRQEAGSEDALKQTPVSQECQRSETYKYPQGSSFIKLLFFRIHTVGAKLDLHQDKVKKKKIGEEQKS